MKQIFSVCLLEIKLLKKNKVLMVLGFLLLTFFPLTLTPLVKGSLWSARESIYEYMYGFCGTQVMFVPIFMIALYHQDSNTDITKVIFTQPLNKYEYALGKFLSVFLIQFVYFFLGIVLLIFTPIKFGKLPYSPLNFVHPFLIYYLPTALFICSICYLTIIVFKNPIIGFFLPTFVYIVSEKMSDTRFQIVIGGKWFDILKKGDISLEVYNAILTNRLIFLFVGILILLGAIIIYSPKSYIERGGRI